MTPQLQAILNAIKNNTDLSESEREALVKSIKEADKTQSLSQFKLDRLEKDRNTLTIMLQESIEDLQKKSRAIEAQNRELEIESSLEKVRTVAMGMRRRDDMLDVCQVIARQLESLKVKEIRNVQTAIFDENKGTYANYEFYVKHDKSLVTEVDYKDHPVAKGFADQMLKGPNQVWIYAFKGKEVTDWLNYQKSTNVFIDTYLENADTLNYYWSSLGPVAIGISAYVPLNEEEVELFKRFRNVFELAYRRYLDIEKAEAQAREAQIEAALERVRSQSMAMRTSEELKNVVKELRKQIGLLGQQELDTCVIQLYDESPDYIHSLASMKPTESNEEILDFDRPIPKKGLLIHEEALQAYSSGRKDYIILNEKRKLEQWIGFIKETYPDIYSVFISTYGAKPEDVPSFWSFSDFNGGSLLMVTLTPPTDVSRALLRRFANVFGQAYRRYVDIKQAEAQARESQIQLAMERVRARTMAMQKSEELADVAELLFKQVNNLGIRTWTTGFNVWSEDNNFYTDYITNPQGGFMPPYTIDAAKLPVTIEVSNAKKRGDEFLVNYEEGESLAETYRQLSKFGEKQFKAILESGFEFPSHQYEHFVFGSKVSLLFITYDPVPEAHEIFKRFGKVFEQTYTRFLDLQKAEAQARESQIEAALERVRSRSMGMQKSEELKEVIQVVYEQFVHLNILIDHTGFIIDYKARDDMHIWLADRHEVPSEVIIPYFDCAHWNSFNEAKEKGMDFFVNQLSFEEKNRFYQDLFKLIPDVPEETLEFYYSCPGLAISTVLLENVGLYIENFSAIPYSDEENNTLMRFGKVFQQTYTRFVDLQKAEAQARESQIEAVLERIRSRTMAMQKSGELTDVAGLLFAQVSALDIKTWTAGFNVWSEDNDSYIDYITSPNGGFIEPYTVYTETAEALTDISDARKSGVEFDVQYVEGEKIKQLYRALTKLGEKQFEIMLQDGVRFPSHQYEHFVFGSKVSLMFITYEPVLEAHDIFKRLGKVFEQTYTRFLDLQKAEAQAREAQIEASLERVRSKTMAMHNSQDVGDTVAAMFAEFVNLGIHTNRCGILIFNDDGTAEVWTARSKADGKATLIVGWLNLRIHKMLNFVFDAWKAKETFYQYNLAGDDLIHYYQAINNSKYYPTQFDLNALPQKEFHSDFFFNEGAVFSFTNDPLPEDCSKIMKRFAAVFGQTYRRYLDLQKAEAQAREAQIEASLEKVRSSAMSMHNSNDISTTTTVVFIELEKLGIQSLRCGVVLLSKNSRTAQVYAAATSADGELKTLRRSIQMTDHPSQVQQYESWLSQKTYIAELKGEELKSYYHLPFFFSSPSYVPPQDYEQSEFGYYIPFSEGLFYAWTKQAYSESELNILNRFKTIIDLTFRRFLDLQKAETQAREGQIEAALERVRSKAMAMHKTEDFHPAVAVVFEELDKLDLGVLRCGISVLNKEKRTGDVWLTSTTEEGSAVQVTGDESFDIHPLLAGTFDAWLRQEDFDYILEGDDLTEYYKAVKDARFKLPESQFVSSEIEFKRQYAYVAVYHAGGLFAFRETEFPDEAKKVMRRFANVFDLTYKRFVDLQRAEAQAREAKIEAAMEKVRGRAMAMQKADELVEVAELLRKEMGLLVEELETSSIYIHHEDSGTTECWYAIQDIRGDDKKLVTDHMTINLNDTWVGREMLKFYDSDETQTSIVMQGENRKEWINDCSQHSKVLQGYYGDVIPERTYHLAKFSNGYMGAASPGELSALSWDLLKRATNVFSLAYTRFNDLQLAEAQAREATIEAALERVRAKAMAMHNSEDVSLAASMVFTELRKLGINPIRCGVGLLNNESLKAPLYSATSSADGDSLSLVGWVMLEGHPVLEKIYEKWLLGEDYFPELTGESLKSYYDQLLSGLSVPVPDFKEEQKQYGHFFSFSIGCLYAWSDVKYNDDQIKILKRFASIIDLTFRRYMDLQKSEANTREAVKQAALDRIRADIASMRTVSDLDRITPLIWNELTILGLPFIRCGVFLMDDSQKLIHTFLSTPNGKAIGAFHMPFDTPGNLQNVLSHWRINERYIDHWDDEEFVRFANILARQGAIASTEQYLKTLPAGGFHLHFLPFLQGMLYVGNTTQLNEEQVNLVQSVAEAFSTAYARYEDFNKLEAAKEQIEKTLVDLKQTQQQLIQSEKMASLGELTAGIAHEIQNPLNFVNNFSEVSNELLDEMKQELERGNGQEAIEIVDNVKQNLEKILHHGKRADGIVKGMLQHSRTSSGQKELTDINALADEYLRLAYHGLRAKDKTFNAKFEIDLDKSIEKISVVPQEIGRVILNLINNAFYTVSEKKRHLNGTYEPTVIISTKRYEDKVEVKVKDNGNGIPQKVMEKIFQPFFTTKPTGQGTGLGLSLSYDIITKGHGGELKVETREGEGSEFIIQLPA